MPVPASVDQDLLSCINKNNSLGSMISDNRWRKLLFLQPAPKPFCVAVDEPARAATRRRRRRRSSNKHGTAAVHSNHSATPVHPKHFCIEL